ncbi:MAG: dihydroorotase [Cycloclasticus sp. symbiont of Poecilosclerida sp. M]|nr:MAG: dihydroorotase [Cycloclasticus sp. symbiont of Poecilosclerida sp. M]
MKEISITQPDDWHLHVRDGAALLSSVPFTARQFKRAIIMPNLAKPVVNVEMALAYRNRILDATPQNIMFDPLMTLYLTNKTSREGIKQASQSKHVHAAKLYPAGATTNSDKGVSKIDDLWPVFEQMEIEQLPLLVHAEVTDTDIDIFDREQVFIDLHLSSIREAFPELPIVLEHATTAQAVEFVKNYKHTAATLTPQHLLFNRNALLVGGIQPHNYCLPILKRETHREALITAATSGDPKFFLGTDSAPHTKQAKENSCGCAGCFTAHAAMELYTEIFDAEDALDKLEAFSSFYGADFYRLPRNKSTITLIKKEWQAPKSYPFAEHSIVPFRHEQALQWQIAD